MTIRNMLCSPYFLSSLSRYELRENKKVYLKAVRVTLIALGYDEDFIDGDFRECLEQFYED